LDALRLAWTEQQHAHEPLERLAQRVEATRAEADHYTRAEAVLAPLRERVHAGWAAADAADQAGTGAQAALDARAEQLAAALRQAWEADLPAADHAAATLAAGPGRLGLHRAGVRDAAQALDTWTAKWQPVLDDAPSGLASRPAAFPSTTDRIGAAIYHYAQARAAHELPEHTTRLHAATQARERSDAAAHAYYTARAEMQREADNHGVPYHEYDTGAAEELPALTEQLHQAREHAATADQRVQRLEADPALTGHPYKTTLLDAAHISWTHDREQASHAAHLRAGRDDGAAARERVRAHQNELDYSPGFDHSGPSIGR
jgi:hypothetical protein